MNTPAVLLERQPPDDIFDRAFADSEDPILQRAGAETAARRLAAKELIAPVRRALARLDPCGIDRAVTVCFWGRSGSLLLQSFMDNHPQIVTLPGTLGQSLYPFLAQYESLTLWQKLLAYPAFSSEHEKEFACFFEGRYGVSPAHYYAAVAALYETFGERPAAWLQERRRFIQFVHVAHALAAQRELATARPIIVSSQHWPDDARARAFLEDFPQAQFLHTIRDPISAVDSWYDRNVSMTTFALKNRGLVRRELGLFSAVYLDPSGLAVRQLLRTDAAHSGMQERSRAVRFEDLHLQTEGTMRRLAEWLGVEYSPTMLESTFNGVPFVWEAEGRSWVGTNPANAVRRSRNLSKLDCLLLFALLDQNFRHWQYPSPLLTRSAWLRRVLIALLASKPMRLEWLNARLIWQRQIVPALRSGRVGFALGAPCYMVMRRGVMWAFVLVQARSRERASNVPLQIV